MSKNPEINETMEALHTEVANTLLNRIKSGEASPSEMSNAIRFLKDNGIDSALVPESPLMNLVDSLPFQDPESPIQSVG
jgi:hypothetical protein